GTSFYFPAVFAEPIVKETGWSSSIGLLTAGLISRQVGRIIDIHGGRPVFLASLLFYPPGLTLVGFRTHCPSFCSPGFSFAWEWALASTMRFLPHSAACMAAKRAGQSPA